MGKQYADECGRSTSCSCRRRTNMAQTGIVSNVLFVASLACLLQVAVGDGKTLVLLDNPNIKDTHSIFFRSLAGEYLCLRIHLSFIMFKICFNSVVGKLSYHILGLARLTLHFILLF